MNPDDPKFTAHILGEQDDLTLAERAEIEALLASDPNAAAEADELRSLAARLRAELPGEEAGALQAEQREAVIQAATATFAEKKIVSFRWGKLLKIAAVFVACAAVGAVLFPALSVHKEQAKRSTVAVPNPPDLTRVPLEEKLTVQDPSGLIASNPEPAPAPPFFMASPQMTPAPMTTPRPMELASINPASTPVFKPFVSEPRKAMEPTGTVELEKSQLAKEAPVTASPGMPIAPPPSQSLATNRPGPVSQSFGGSAKAGATRSGFAKDPTKADGTLTAAPEVTTAPSSRTGGLATDQDRVTQLSNEAQSFYDTGRFDLAKKRSEQILGIDKSNIGARQMQEKIERKVNDYGIVTYNETRADMIRHVDLAWQRPIRRFNTTENVSVPMPASTAMETLPVDKVPPSDSGKIALNSALASGLPESVAAESVQAIKAFQAGDYARAAKLYKAIDELLPNNVYVLSNLGVAEFRQGKFGSATDALNKAVALAPGDAFSHTVLGVVHYSQAKYDEAVNALTKALALDPKNATAHNYLGITASQKGWKDAAVKELETAARLDPAYADSYFNLAVVLAMQNPPDKARAHWSYRRAISLGAEPDRALEQLIGTPDPQTAVAFDELAENGFMAAKTDPLSTFSIDVDTASYSMVRKFLRNDQRPPKGSVRIEELLNYFTYDYEQPKGKVPFSAAMEVAACPWTPEHRLVRVALKGREMDKNKRPASNLVFLIDVSGSMRPDNKLPLLKESLGMLVEELNEEDQVAIVVYAGNSGCVLEPTNDKRKMRAALQNLEAGGSTNGGSGVELAYKLAEKSFIKGGTNRVILATDGDWNVGITDRDALVNLIKRKAKSGVFLTVLGVGMDNLKDATLVKLADSGNGNYAYLDTVTEAKKVLVKQLSGTLVTIAKDVKIQVEFNPAQVDSYRLIGYEKRMLAKEDFNNDKKDAGEIGAGHTVTALYEVVPAGQQLIAKRTAVDALKYQSAPAATAVPETAPAMAKNDPGDAFVNGYMAVQSAEKAEQGGDLPQALKKYDLAAAIFAQVAETWPAWQPEIVKYRQQRTAEALSRVRDRINQQTGTPITPGDDRKMALKQSPAEAEQRVLDEAQKVKATAASKELLTLKLRYKEPEGDTSKLLEFPLIDHGGAWEKSSADFRFAAAVAGYGMLLRESQYKGDANWSAVAEWAEEGKGKDESGYRAEFLTLVQKAQAVCR